MRYFPFTAVVGQSSIKEALMLTQVNPKIGGLLINGESGSAKTTLVRSMAEMMEKSLTEIPLNVSEERLLGTLDMEESLRTGRVVVEQGLLARANGGIAYVDEVNFLQDAQVDILLQVSAANVLHLEREGMSLTQDCSFLMIGTMNDAEGGLRPQFLDRFALYAQSEHCESEEQRVEVMRRNMAFAEGNREFIRTYESRNRALAHTLRSAAERLDQVEVCESDYRRIAQICLEAGVDGHRADLMMLETAKAVAALRNRTSMQAEDFEEAAYFVLPHRRKELPPPPETEEDEDKDNKNDHEPEEQENDRSSDDHNHDHDHGQQDAPPQEQSQSDALPDGQGADATLTQTFAVGEPFKVAMFGHRKDRRTHRGSGKRTDVKTIRKSGRYIGSTMNRTNQDLALDATIRAAAPYQSRREKGDMAIAIRQEDIREKLRQRKLSNLLVFVVDASGSMGAQKRMIEAKGAVLSLLKDAYVKRDKVAMVVFRGGEAATILPPTSSVERGYRLLHDMETGGKTPLNAGLLKGLEIIQSSMRKNPDILPMLIVITDGKGNVPAVKGKKPIEEMLEIAKKVREVKAIDTMIIDIERSGMMRFGLAQRLADEMGGGYCPMEHLKASEIVKQVRRERHHHE